MMTKVSSIIHFDKIVDVLVGEDNILMTGGGSLFKFCINSSVASPYRERRYFTFRPHLIDLFPLFKLGLSQTYFKARELTEGSSRESSRS